MADIIDNASTLEDLQRDAALSMHRLNQVSMNIHSDLFETKEEAMEQLGRWLVRLGEALQEHNFK